MKKLLVLGTSHGQVPIIKAAKKMGLCVIGVDRNENAPGRGLCDFFFPVDFSNKSETLRIAQSLNVNGVVTFQSDASVPTVGFLNTKLNLNGPSFDTATTCTNKIHFRNSLKLTDCAQPRFHIVENIEDATEACKELGLPCVIKCADSSGSRGVTKVNALRDIPHAMQEAKKYTSLKDVLVEEFIHGVELGAQTFSQNGKCELVVLHNDLISPPPFMVPIGHSMPVKNLEQAQINSIKSDIIKAVNAINLEEGPANIDFILTDDLEVKIIEIGARVGATCLPELMSFHLGLDWAEVTIQNALGTKVELLTENLKPVAAQVLTSPSDGILKSFSLPSELCDKCIEYELSKGIGEQVSLFRKGTDRIGKVMATGGNVEDAENQVSQLVQEFHFEVV